MSYAKQVLPLEWDASLLVSVAILSGYFLHLTIAHKWSIVLRNYSKNVMNCCHFSFAHILLCVFETVYVYVYVYIQYFFFYLVHCIVVYILVWIYIGVHVMGFLASTLNWIKQIFPPIQSVAPVTLYNAMYTRTYTIQSIYIENQHTFEQTHCKYTQLLFVMLAMCQ